MGTHGEGTVGYDKSKRRFFARIPVGHFPNGKVRYKKRYADTKIEAHQVRRILIAEREAEEVVRREPVAFEAFARLHLEGEARNEIREVTRRGYLYLLSHLAFPTLGHRPIGGLKSAELSAFLVALRPKYSAPQINHLRAAMSRVFTAAQNHQIIDDNPMRRTKKMRALPTDRTLTQQPWTLEECRRAMDVAVGTPMDLFIHLAILTGARLGELLGLQWKDIDLEAKTITIRRTLTEQRGSRSESGQKSTPTFGPPKTPRSVRTLSYGERLSSALARHTEAQGAVREADRNQWMESDCLFTTKHGDPVWTSNFTARYRRFLRNNGLRHQNVHALRHAFAINALSIGVDLASISRALGHASLQVTLDVYAKEATNLQDRATGGLAEYFKD